MAKPGPKPTPTVKKRLQGNPGKRSLPKNEPKPRNSMIIPRSPEYLDNVGKKEWRRMGKELHKIGLLSNIDMAAFAAYCQQYSMWVMATKKVQEHGVLIKAQSGYPMQSPYFTIQNKAQSEMRKWLTEFGMTPSSRSRVQVEKEQESDPMEDFIRAGRKLKSVK